MAVGAVGAALSTTFVMLVGWRFVQGVGSGIYMTVSGAVLMQLARPGERGRIMAMYQGSLLLGGGIGPGIGGFLAEHFGFAAPFWALFAVAAAALALALTAFVEPPAVEHPGGKPKMVSSVGSLLRLTPYVLLLVITVGVFFTRTASMWVLIPIVGHDTFGLSVDIIGAALSVSALANFLMLPIVGPAIDRLGSRSITIASTVLTGLGLAMLALTSGVAWFWIAIVILGIGNGFGGPSVGAAMAEIVPNNLYGPAMGLQRMIGDAAFVAGPIVVGLLSDIAWIGNNGSLIANALLMIGAGAIFAIGSRAGKASAT
jgi:MFS family permease